MRTPLLTLDQNSYVNDSIRESEQKARLLEIHKSFYKLGDHLSLIEPHRTFVREGTLTKVCRSSRKVRRFFLFNDLLVYASTAGIGSKHIFHGSLELGALRVEDVPDSEAKKLVNAFLIVAAKKSFVVRCYMFCYTRTQPLTSLPSLRRSTPIRLPRRPSG